MALWNWILLLAQGSILCQSLQDSRLEYTVKTLTQIKLQLYLKVVFRDAYGVWQAIAWVQPVQEGAGLCWGQWCQMSLPKTVRGTKSAVG